MTVYSHVVRNIVGGNLRTSPNKMCCKWEQHPWTLFSCFYFLTSSWLLLGGYGWGGGVKVHVHDLYIYTVFITIVTQNLKSGIRSSKWIRKCTDQWSLSTCKSDRSGLWSLKKSKHFLHKHLDNLPVRLTKCPSPRKNRLDRMPLCRTHFRPRGWDLQRQNYLFLAHTSTRIKQQKTRLKSSRDSHHLT